MAWITEECTDACAGLVCMGLSQGKFWRGVYIPLLSMMSLDWSIEDSNSHDSCDQHLNNQITVQESHVQEHQAESEHVEIATQFPKVLQAGFITSHAQADPGH
jgi:hypothetical protein